MTADKNLRALAEQAYDNAEWSEAEQLFRQAINHCEIALGPNHMEVASMLHCLARVLYHLNRQDESDSCRLRADRIMCHHPDD